MYRPGHFVMIVLLLGTSGAVFVAAKPSAPPPYAPFARVGADTDPAWSPDGQQILFSRGNVWGSALYRVSPSGGPAQRLPIDGIHAQPDFSPDGRRIAFAAFRDGAWQIMSMTAEGTGVRSVIHMEGSFLWRPRYSPDGRWIAFNATPGPRVMVVSSGGGMPKTLGRGTSPAWSPDGARVAYVGGPPTDMSWSVMVQPVAGGDAVRLPAAPAMSEDQQVDWSRDGKRLVCTTFRDGDSHLLILRSDTGETEREILLDGFSTAPRWSPDGRRIAFAWSDTANPSRIKVVDAGGNLVAALTSHRAYARGRLVRYKSADGTEIPAYLYLPERRGGRRIPALVWLHGGLGGFAGNSFEPTIQYFADHGLAVLALNYRSSGGFGLALTKFDTTGRKEVEDIRAGVDGLRGMPEIDSGRIGVVGFSFGGLMALQSITREPELFTAAVDFFGMTDIASWYRDMPGMRPLLRFVLGGTPEEKPEAYREASPFYAVDRIRAPLLILHGENDATVPVSQARALAAALRKAGKNYEALILPGQGHGFVGESQERAMEATFHFLSRYLSPEGTGLLPGDLDGDGEITRSDITLALRAVLGVVTLTPDQAGAIDVNRDGEMRIGDVIRILRTALSLLPDAP